MPCPICNSGEFKELINFGYQPLCSHLFKQKNAADKFHAGQYIYCTNCHFIQIAEQVSLEEQYDEHLYFSSVENSASLKKSALKMTALCQNKKDGLVVDIGSNDGRLLLNLKENGFSNLLGVEASSKIAKQANLNHIRTLNTYFNRKTAAIISEKYGHPTIIIAKFLLEHIPDLKSFMKGLDLLSKNNPYILIEVPDMDYILKKGLYTSFFDQHINYFNIHTLHQLFLNNGFSMDEYFYQPSLGAEKSIVGIFRKKTDKRMMNDGEKISVKIISEYQTKVKKNLKALKDLVGQIHDQNKTIALYGASHNPANIVNYSGIGKSLCYAVDKQENKVGRYLPGSKLEVKSPEYFNSSPPDYCIIAALGSEDKIVDHHIEFLKNGGKFIRLFPLEIIDR